MVVGSCAFKWFEAFDCSVNLLVRDVLECCTWVGIFEVWVDLVILWRGEEKGIIQSFCLIFVFLDFFDGAIGLFNF